MVFEKVCDRIFQTDDTFKIPYLLDLIFRTLLTTGVTRQELAKVIMDSDINSDRPSLILSKSSIK